MTKRTILIACIVALALILGAVWVKRQLAIDSCLDSGGRFDYDNNRCDRG